MVKQTTKNIKKRAKRFTMVAIMVNYDYEVGRLKGKIAPFEAWYQQQVENLKRFCSDANLGCASKEHDRDFKRDKNHVLIHDEAGNLIPDAKHFHAVLVNYSKKPATLKQWAEALEIHGVHISKVSDIPTLSNISGISMRKPKSVESALGYLVHATPNARKMQKFPYKASDVVLINMEKFFEVKTPADARKAYDDLCRKEKLTVIEFEKEDYGNYFQIQREEISKGVTVRTLQEQYKKYFGSYYSYYEVMFLGHLQKARQNYLKALSQQLPYHKRNFHFIHIYGRGGIGKSALATSLAGLLAGEDMRIHIAATPDKRKTPDILSTYTSELVTVAHELRPSSFTTSGFESFMDPNVYPTVSSRNQDKPYFAKNFILANSQHPMDWLYQLFYWDLLYGDGAEVNFGYNAFAGKDDVVYFPRSWQQLRDKDYDFFQNHWTPEGMRSFLDEWWQLIRRLGFSIELTPLNANDKSVKATVYRFDESSVPECLRKPKSAGVTAWDFIVGFILANHVKKIYETSCPDITNMQWRAGIAKNIFVELVKNGVCAPTKLPALLKPEELQEKTGLKRPKMQVLNGGKSEDKEEKK